MKQKLMSTAADVARSIPPDADEIEVTAPLTFEVGLAFRRAHQKTPRKTDRKAMADILSDARKAYIGGLLTSYSEGSEPPTYDERVAAFEKARAVIVTLFSIEKNDPEWAPIAVLVLGVLIFTVPTAWLPLSEDFRLPVNELVYQPPGPQPH